MTHAVNYRNIESDVIAYKLTSVSTGEIGKILGREAASQLLATLSAEYNDAVACHDYKFRYKDETTDSSLSLGDYLVQLNTGKYIAKSPEEFEAEFINTTNDTVPVEPKNVADNFASKMKEKYVDLSIKDREDCFAKITQVVEKLRDWYNHKANMLTMDFTNYAMVSPTEISSILSSFKSATYIDDNTQIMLVFNNIGPASKNIKEYDSSSINALNYIGLQELVGELKNTDKQIRNKIISMSFVGVNGAPSAVASSVTEGQWLDIIDEFRNITAISRNSSVTR